MRHKKTIPLELDRSVTVQELRVRDARQVMAQAKTLEQVEIKELLTERFDEVGALLGDCIVLPEGETLADLSFSEIKQVTDGLIEVNEAFLELIGLAGLNLSRAETPTPAPENSTAPVSPSSNEDMPA